MNSTARNRALVTALIFLLAAGQATAGEINRPAASAAVEDITVIPARIVIPQEWNVLSRAAARILRHIADARGEIAKKNPKAALADLGKIDAEVTTIKEGRPVAIIEDHISIAKKHLEYEKTTEVADDLIPISSDLALLEDIVPITKARKHLAAAKKQLQNGNRKAAGKELTALEESVGISEIDLPLAETVHRVERARQYLRKNRLGEADKQLKAAEDGVQILSIAVEEPIAMATRSLQKAKKHHQAHRDQAAKADLENASAWIMRARQSADSKVQAEAAQLNRAVQELAAKLK